MDEMTRKLMTMQRATSERKHKQVTCVKKRRESTNIEDCVDASTQDLEEYIKKERLITAARKIIGI